MSRPDRNPQRVQILRRNITALAARMMAEDGIDDYGLAKRKAARQLGAPATEALPNNSEIETELRAYQAIYQGVEQSERLLVLRRAASGIMRLLDDFKPYLSGPVLDGTAGRFSAIELEAYPDSSKDIEIFLLNRGIRFEQDGPPRNSPEQPESILQLDWEGFPVRLSLYEPDAERVQKRRNGRSVQRVRLAGVEALIGTPTP